MLEAFSLKEKNVNTLLADLILRLLWNNHYQQSVTHCNAILLHMQRRNHLSSPCLWSKCRFSFAVILEKTAPFLFQLHEPLPLLIHCMCFAHHWEWSFYYFIIPVLSIGQIQLQKKKNTTQQSFISPGTFNFSTVPDRTCLQTNCIIKKTRNLWIEILFTMCILTTSVSFTTMIDTINIYIYIICSCTKPFHILITTSKIHPSWTFQLVSSVLW